MYDAVKGLFSPPVFADPEKTRIAGMLNVTLWGIIFLGIILIVADPDIARPISAGLVAGAILLHAALRRGYVRLTGYLVTTMFFASGCVSVYVDGTIRNPGIEGYVLAIASAGLFTGKRGLVIFTALSAVTIVGLYQVEQRGMLSPVIFEGPGANEIITALVYVTAMSTLSILLFLAITSIETAFARAHSSAEELKRSNQELRTLQNSLEEEVIERTRIAETARERAEAAQERLSAQVWLVTGKAQLNEVLRGEQSLDTLADKVIGQVCRYLELPGGALYLCDETRLHLKGRYAYARRSQTRSLMSLNLGEGLAGQAARDRKVRIFGELSAAHFVVLSGLGQTYPRHVLVAPFVYEDRVTGVLELGALKPFTPLHVQFVEQILETIAIAFNTARNRDRINDLLTELHQQTLELQGQREELQVINEDLQNQTDDMREAQQKPRAGDREAGI